MQCILAVVLLILVSGCTDTSTRALQNYSENESRMQAARKASEGKPLQFGYVAYKSAVDDGIQLFFIRIGVGTPASRDIAELVATNGKGLGRIAVSGPNDSVAALSLIDGINRNEGRQFPALEIVYLGEGRRLAELRAATEAIGAKFTYVKYSSPNIECSSLGLPAGRVRPDARVSQACSRGLSSPQRSGGTRLKCCARIYFACQSCFARRPVRPCHASLQVDPISNKGRGCVKTVCELRAVGLRGGRHFFGFLSSFLPNRPSAQPPTFAPTDVPSPGPISAVPTAAPAIVPPVG